MRPPPEDPPSYLCLPDGTVVYDPKEEDFSLWREEARDLWPEPVDD